MKKMMRNILAVGMTCVMMMAMVGCGSKSKEEKKSKKKEKATTTTAVTVSADKPDDAHLAVFENVVYVTMSDGKWKEDPTYVYTQSDFKAYFNEVSDQHVFEQLLLSKGLWTGEGEKYRGSNGATYDFLADSTRYSNFLHTMYGVDYDFYTKLTTEDLSQSSLYYDETTDSIYIFDGMVADMSCHYERTEMMDDLTMNVYFSVSNEVDDGTPFNGEIVLNLALVEDAYGDYCLTSVSFTPAK